MLEPNFRALLEAAPDAMVIVDGAGTMVLVNTQTERLFGYARAELIGQSVDMLVPTRFRGRHPQHRSGYFADSRVREMGSGLELYALRRDGTEFPVEVSLSPLHTDDGVLVTSAIRDITERRKAREKELLLKEIHHRVKNNLQVISSILKLHAERMQSPEAQEAFEDAQLRVRAIALLHESLHDTRESGPVDFASYARSLVDSLTRLANIDVRLEVEVSDVRLSLDQALPCGLILNELVTNAIKHAFLPPFDGEVRRVRVEAARHGAEVTMVVSDNGRGFPATPREGSLGLHLVRTLVRQLDGQLSVGTGAGARVALVFPVDVRGGS